MQNAITVAEGTLWSLTREVQCQQTTGLGLSAACPGPCLGQLKASQSSPVSAAAASPTNDLGRSGGFRRGQPRPEAAGLGAGTLTQQSYIHSMARFVEGCSPRIRELVAARAKRPPPAPPVQAQPMHSLALHKPPAQSHLAAPRPLVMPGPSIGSSSIPPHRCGCFRHTVPGTPPSWAASWQKAPCLGLAAPPHPGPTAGRGHCAALGPGILWGAPAGQRTALHVR